MAFRLIPFIAPANPAPVAANRGMATASAAETEVE